MVCTWAVELGKVHFLICEALRNLTHIRNIVFAISAVGESPFTNDVLETDLRGELSASTLRI